MNDLEIEQFKTEFIKLWSVCKQSTKLIDFQREQEVALLVLAEQYRDGRSLNDAAKKISGREKTLTRMAQFLWEYEGYYMYCIDTVCRVLIIIGHDLSYRGKYVKSIKEIEVVDSGIKLDFLKEHNLGMLNRNEDRQLRNKIAHRDYSIDDDGILMVDHKIVEIGPKLIDLVDFSNKVMNALSEHIDKQ